MAPPSSSCVKCRRVSAASTGTVINDGFVCRWCEILEEFKAELQVERDIRSRLENRVISLEEEVVLLQGRINRLGGSVKKSAESGGGLTSRNSNSNRNSSLTYSEAVQSNMSNEFISVKNGAKPKAKPIINIKTYNSFSILGCDNLDEPEVRLAGDSIVRGQLEEFCGRNPKRRKLYCIPGAKVDDVIGNSSEIMEYGNDKTTYILHVGTNEIHSTRSEELLDKYRKLIRNFKVSSNNIIVSGILPRITWRNDFFGKASYINNSLKAICQSENIEFLNFWNNFYGNELMFRPDGLHLNDVGCARFGRLLDKAVSTFHSKNGHVLPRTSTH